MLRISDVSVSYEGEKVLEHIDLSFKKGEVSVITGGSGSGKSTLIKLINGIIPEVIKARVQGDISYGEVDLMKMDISERSDYVSTVFQNPKTQFYCTGTTDEIAFGMENRGIDREEIKRRIAVYSQLLKTSHLLGRDLFRLSGGEKQMVAITAVACMEQDICIFDEPSSSLDRESIGQLKYAIEKLKEMGKIVIIAEHRLYYLKDLADHFYVLKDGRILETDRNETAVQTYGLRRIEEIRKEELKSGPYFEKDVFSKDFRAEERLLCADYRYSYTRGRPVFDMNFSLEGEVNFIIGNNGVGKTTFIRSLCGLQRKFKGRTCFDKEELKHPEELISLVMQDVNYQLFTDSVWQEISIVTEEDEIKERVLEEVGLLSKKDVHPQKLSGGEKQRLSIALCKASKKPIVIFDEPTSGLCKETMMRIIRFIHSMKEEGKLVLIVTHDYEFIRNCGGRIIEFVKD